MAFDRKQYELDYAKEHYRRTTVKIPRRLTDVVEKIESVENINAYILGLIQDDLKREKRRKKKEVE